MIAKSAQNKNSASPANIKKKRYKRIPSHIGLIPDGNRRWATAKELPKEQGYEMGLLPALTLFKLFQEIGIKELSVYGFTMDNNKRPTEQRKAFTNACIKAVELLSGEDAELLVIGNTDSHLFPKELLPYTTRKKFGKGGVKVNFLVNYGWEWDLNYLKSNDTNKSKQPTQNRSHEISRIDMIIRWGGMSRLSGFLPIQSVYSDIYVIKDYWPDFVPEHLYNALAWYQEQDVTLGG